MTADILFHVCSVEGTECKPAVFLEHPLRYIDNPVRRPVPLASLALAQDRLLLNVSNSDIVELSPGIPLVVFDERVVVPTLGAAVMDANCMQLVLVFRQVLVHAFKVVLLRLYLRFELLHLLHCVLFHFFNFLAQLSDGLQVGS